MDITFSCDKCGQHITIDEAGAGMVIQCPSCNAGLTVPQPVEKKCPFCAELIKKDAIVCKHCGRDLFAKLSPISTADKAMRPSVDAGKPRYVSKNLNPSEQVVYSTKLHWIVFGKLIALIALWFILVLVRHTPLFWSLMDVPFLWLAMDYARSPLVLLVILPFLLVAVITYLTSEFAVTNQRVVIKLGWLRRRSLELLLTKIESIQVDQDLLGRVVNAGTIVITGTGGTKEDFENIRAPFEFRKQVQQQADVVQGASTR